MKHDVIISGAGPVGLFLACDLALAKCSVLVLEKAHTPHSPLKKFPFGMRGVSAPTIEAFHDRGLLEELALQTPRQSGHFAGIPFPDHIDISHLKFPPSLIAEMETLETVLTRRAIALGVDIRYGLAITDFHQTSDSVTVQAGDQTFEAQWLVGCDGGRSLVRKLGGFEFTGTEPAFTGYTTLLDIASPALLKPGRNQTPTGMYLQTQPGYVTIQDFDGGAFHATGQPVTAEHIQALLRRMTNTDVTINAVTIATIWTDRARQTTSYRNGRILLAGDAAHIHAPLGGQGLNLGIGDAVNLGWKLAATIHHEAAEGLLDTYQKERHPIGAQVLDWSRAQVAIMQPNPQSQALRAIFQDLMNTRDGAAYFAGKVWGVTPSSIVSKTPTL